MGFPHESQALWFPPPRLLPLSFGSIRYTSIIKWREILPHPGPDLTPPGPKAEADATVVAPLPQKDGGKEGDEDDEEEGLIPVGVAVGSRGCSPE